MRELSYRILRPCEFGGGCPFGEDPSECQAAKSTNHASRCPGTEATHAWRRGSITHHLREGTPPDVVSDRMDVTRDVLDEHYDMRSESEKRERRRDHLHDV